ncbi:33947_t:CDS:1, partial [Racocetra persica]
MATLEQAIAKLREVQKFTTVGRVFTEEELKIKSSDSILIITLKKHIQCSEIIKQKDQDIASLKVKIG